MHDSFKVARSQYQILNDVKVFFFFFSVFFLNYILNFDATLTVICFSYNVFVRPPLVLEVLLLITNRYLCILMLLFSFLDGTIKKIAFLLVRMITINSLKDRIAQREK